jgi:hypothetical protein
MKGKVQIISKVIDNKITRNRKALEKAVAEFNGKEIVITIEKKSKKHSDNQRGYYFGVIVNLVRLAILETWGDKLTSAEVHEILKLNCNWTERINKDTGEVIKIPQSIKQHTTSDQEDYHVNCRQWAEEWFNIEIPLPNEQIEIKV